MKFNSYMNMRKLLLLSILIYFSVLSFGQGTKKKFTRDFYFEYASFELDSLELIKANKFVSLLDRFNFVKIEVIGHTDSDGSSKANMALSKKRIETVTQILGSIDRDSLFKVTAKGENDPLVPNTDSTKHKNRRVTVIAYYSGKKGAKKKVKKQEVIAKKEPEIAPSTEVKIKKEDLVSGKTIELPMVQFYGGTDMFLPGSEDVLRDIVPLLRANPELRIEIAGHICCGNDMNLSIARAFKVFDFLVSQGVSRKMLRYEGYNNTQPKYGNIMDIRNRRVELRVL